MCRRGELRPRHCRLRDSRGPVLGGTRLEGAIALYALTLLTSTFDAVARAVLRVFDRFRDLAVQTVIGSLSGLGIMILILAIQRSVQAVLMANLLSDLVEAAVLVKNPIYLSRLNFLTPPPLIR